MKIEIIKETDIVGDVSYAVKVANSHHKYFSYERDAMAEVERIKASGGVKSEVIFSEEVTINQ